MLKFLAIAIFLTSLRTAAMAQVTTASPGYLFPNDQYQRDRAGSGGMTTEQPAPVDVDIKVEIELDAAAQARVRAAVEALAPEYNVRRQRDGEARANDWIRQKAFELGQQEAALMQQRLGLE